MDALTKKKSDRFRFLDRLYKRTDGDSSVLENMWEVGTDVGLTQDEAERVMDYLNGEGLAAYRTNGGYVAITHEGIREVESALSAPKVPTHHSPAVVNVLQVQSMVGSQIQQGSHGSTQTQTQTQTITQNELAAIQELVAALQPQLAALGLNAESMAEAEAELQTLKAQLQSSKPKSTIIRESLKTLRNLVEGVASNAAGAFILPLFTPLTALIDS